MKLYLKDIQNLNTKNIKQYKCATSKIEKLFSDEGIFLINNNKYKKELSQTGVIKTVNYDNKNDLIVDLSKVYYEDEYKIPFDHIYVEYTKETFTLRDKAIVKLNIIYSNKLITDAYFESNYHYNDFALKEDIISFNRLLN
jgi:hypothetical protein